MKYIFRIIVFLAIIYMGTFGVGATAGINRKINFQGKVVNKGTNDGTNIANGNYNFKFSLWSTLSAGTSIWSEVWDGGTAQVTVADGIFTVALGTYQTFPPAVDFNSDSLYLSVNFNSDGEMTPRIQMTAVPYAFNAEKVAGLTVTNTTGTLTIPDGKTIAFGDSFTTTGVGITLNQSLATTDQVTFAGLNVGGTISAATTNTINGVGISSGVITAASGTTIASQTFTTNNITDSGALTVSSGGGSNLTLNSASGNIVISANDGLTFETTTNGNNGSLNVTIPAGSSGTIATLLVQLDTSGQVVTTNTTVLNNAVGVALETKSSGQTVRVATSGMVTVTADNTVTTGDYIGIGTATAGRAKSLGTSYPSTAGIQVVGRAISSASTGSTFILMLSGLDNSAGSSSSSGGDKVESQIIFFADPDVLVF